MCKAMEKMRSESLEEGRKQNMMESALRMLKAGKYTLEEIVSISGLSLEEVQKLKTEKSL